jgi:hypothetical protein
MSRVLKTVTYMDRVVISNAIPHMIDPGDRPKLGVGVGSTIHRTLKTAASQKPSDAPEGGAFSFSAKAA